jgi:hypothetical protein
MKDVKDVEKDIYTVLDSGLDHDPSPELAAEYAMRIGGEMAKSTRPRSQERESGKLWASDLGESCNRKTYYKFAEPDKAAPLLGHTKFKFLYGNILEEAVLYMAEEAGHKVEAQQNPVKISIPLADGGEYTVSGRIDAVVDNVLLDVKTTSSFGYKKYEKEGLNKGNDAFGYLYQLGYYHHFLEEVPNRKAGECGFLWIDKQNGHIMYQDVSAEIPTKDELFSRIKDKIQVIEGGTEPARPTGPGFAPKPEGKSGNMKLDIKCSYCDFKNHCYRDVNGGKGLRTFAYNYGPVSLTDVTREPRVPEIT